MGTTAPVRKVHDVPRPQPRTIEVPKEVPVEVPERVKVEA